MITRRMLSMILVIALALSSMTTFCEDSQQQGWREWALKVLNLDKETAEKFMPTALLVGGLIAGGIYLYWTSQKGGPTPSPIPEQQPVTPVEPEQLPTPVKTLPVQPVVQPVVVEPQELLQQLAVYSQSNPDGGGPASCGYHTLLRSMQVVKGLWEIERNKENMDELKETLMKQSVIEPYFGEKGKWRQEIIKKRKMDEFKKLLHTNFVLALNLDKLAEKEADLYKSVLGFLEEDLVDIAKNPETINLPYDFTDDIIRGYIKKGLLKLEASIKEYEKKALKPEDKAVFTKSLMIIDELEKTKKIDMSFNYEKMRDTVFSKDYILGLPALLTEIENNLNFTIDFQGEWLSDGEVEYIWEYHWSEIIPSQASCGFKTIATFDFIGREGFEAVDEFTPYVRANIKSDLNKTIELFQVFALGTMNSNGSTRGHWYPLVMYQNKQGKRIYYVMDSLNNNSHLNANDNVWKLINVIEKK